MNQSGVRTSSINWPAFRGAGMAARSTRGLSELSALMDELADNSFSIAEGTQALIQIVNNDDHERVVLSRKPFADRQEFYIADGQETRIKTHSECGSDLSLANDDPGEAMLGIWRQQFSNEDLTLDDNYFELGGDSLMAIGLIAQIEQSFGNLIPISHLINSPTPRKLVKKMGLSKDSPGIGGTAGDMRPFADWVVPLKESDSRRPPLFLIHGADGSVLFYREFALRLNTDRSIYGIESPFLQDTEHSMPETVEEIAEAYVEQIIRIQSTSPFLLAGYSFGGIVALEIAQQLKQRGLRAEMTVLYDVPNPQLVEHASAIERLRKFWNRQESTSALTKSMQLSRRLGQAVQDRAAVELENRLAKRIASEDEAGGFWRHKKCREHHMTVEQAYEPQPFSMPMGLVVATGNSSKYKTDETQGWSEIASDLSIIEVPGSHLELFDNLYVGNLVSATEQLLKQSGAPGSKSKTANGKPR